LTDNEDYSYKFFEIENEKDNQILNIKKLYKDLDDNLWIGTNSGLYKNQTTILENDFNPQHIQLDRNGIEGIQPGINLIMEDREGHLWVGGENNALFIESELSEHKFDQIKEDISYDIQQNPLIYSCIYQNRNEDILWIGTDISGVRKLTTTSRNFENITSNKKEGNGIINNAVFSIFKDSKGVKWVGTIEGLSISFDNSHFYNYGKSKKLEPLSDQKIRAFEEDQFGNIWIGTSNGLVQLKRKKADLKNLKKKDLNLFKSDYNNPNTLPSDYIYDIHHASDNTLWIATSKGICIYHPKSKSFERIPYLPQNYYNQNAFNIQSLYEDGLGNIWLSTLGGLHRISPKNGSYEYGHFFHDPLDTASICSDKVSHILYASDGNYWVATAHGLNKLSINNSQSSFEYIGIEKGLPNEFIYSIFEQPNGILWMSSNMGIIKYDIQDKTFKNFIREDGIQSNEFNIGAFFKDSDGKICFGGIAGLTEFYPNRIRENKHEPAVYISSIKRFGKELYSLENSTINQKVLLESDENSFTVEFVALDYTNPQRNQYAYMLSNVDQNWIRLGTRRSVNFSQLNPGNYTFKIKGSNNNGIWNETPKELEFTIERPFWLSYQFYIVCLLLLLIAIYLIYRKRLNDQIQYVLEIEQVKQTIHENVRKKAAADFHDEMGHYLTRINVLTEVLKQRISNTSDDIKGIADSIGEQSHKLYNGTRDFIWTINPDNNSIYELGIRLKDFGDELTLDTNINFKIIGLNDSFKDISISTDFARHMVLIFKEGINNAVKHSGAQKIELEFNDLSIDKSPIIILRDDGVGIDLNESIKGNGIKNMRKRAKKINAQLEILTLSPQGTMIVLKSSKLSSSEIKSA
jgi:ligand-binding sensor domain-containing protein/signal transduction histidine kinase